MFVSIICFNIFNFNYLQTQHFDINFRISLFKDKIFYQLYVALEKLERIYIMILEVIEITLKYVFVRHIRCKYRYEGWLLIFGINYINHYF